MVVQQNLQPPWWVRSPHPLPVHGSLLAVWRLKPCLQATGDGWRRSWEEVRNYHLSSPDKLCLCPCLVHMHLFLGCLDSHIPKVVLKQWRWLRAECWEWLRTREDAMQGETQGITSSRVTEEEIVSLVWPSPSSFGRSVLSKCYFRMFSWFSRAFCTSALLPQSAAMVFQLTQSPLHSHAAQALIKLLH